MNYILDTMELTRKYDHLFQKLRKELNIPLRQPLLDYAYGPVDPNKDGWWLDEGYRGVLVGGINILDQGYDFQDKDWYEGLVTERPKGDWKFLEEGNLWVGLYVHMPDWLLKIGEERKKEREEIMQRKYEENTSKTT